MAAAENAAPGMVDPKIFEQLQANIDDDGRVREELRSILQRLERQGTLYLVLDFRMFQLTCQKQEPLNHCSLAHIPPQQPTVHHPNNRLRYPVH